MGEKYIVSIDIGTTSTRAILFDKKGNACFKAQREINCIFPHSGWVETDAKEFSLSTIEVITEVLIKSNKSISDIDSFGITNQRESTIIWDKKTGEPIYNAVIWQSRQSASICDQFAKHKDTIHEKTGLLINPYFSASKIRWILDNVEGAQEKAEKGELLFGTVDSWLIYYMTGGKVHATDVSNASRTMIFNIHSLEWDEELCSLFNIPLCMLPKVFPSSYDYGEIVIFPGGKPHICGVAGDQQAALFGQTCFDIGDCKNTYGTGCFMLLNVGRTIPLSSNGLLTTIAWQIGNEVTYAFEGSVFVGGAVIQWLRDELKLIKNSSESEEKLKNSNLSHDIYIVPAFVGLGTPYWDDDARGAVFGLTRNTNDADFVRASIEAIAYQCKDVCNVMEKEARIKIASLSVDGGASANSYLLQFQSDILQKEIKLPECLETTALGAAYFAGLCTGFYSSLEEIKKSHAYQKQFTPKMDVDTVNRKCEGWRKAVNATRTFK